MILGLASAINHKLVLTNIVQDAIFYLRMNYQRVLKKIPNPNPQDGSLVPIMYNCSFVHLFFHFPGIMVSQKLLPLRRLFAAFGQFNQ